MRSLQVEVVLDLRAIVVLLGFIRVVIADRWIHRDAVDDVAIRLEEREEPVVVFIAGAADRDAEHTHARVDVVAGGEHEADVVGIDHVAQRVGDLLLAAVRPVVPDADAEIADHREGQLRGRHGGIGIGAKAVVVLRAGLHQRLVLRRPVPALAAGPLLPFYEHLVGVFGIGLKTREPAMVGDLGLRARHRRTGRVVDLDHGRTVGRRLRANRVLSRRMHIFQVVVVDDLPFPPGVGTEIEGTPSDERGFVADRRQIKVGLGMKLRHWIYVPL